MVSLRSPKWWPHGRLDKLKDAHLTPSVKTSISGIAIALTVTAVGAVGAVGTANAATPGSSGVVSAALQNRPPPPPPHRFRMKFRSLQECQVRANHDHVGHRADWDCRRGPDRNNPWEYWGR